MAGVFTSRSPEELRRWKKNKQEIVAAPVLECWIAAIRIQGRDRGSRSQPCITNETNTVTFVRPFARSREEEF